MSTSETPSAGVSEFPHQLPAFSDSLEALPVADDQRFSLHSNSLGNVQFQHNTNNTLVNGGLTPHGSVLPFDRSQPIPAGGLPA